MLRIATTEDLEALYRIETECFRERRFRRDHVAWILDNPKALTLTAVEGASIVGSIMLLFDGGAGRVLSVAVLPEARRRGHGKAMMLEAERTCRDRSCSVVRLEVSTRNMGAIEFYRRLGYKVDGVLYGYYSWGDDAYSMAKPVADESASRPATKIAEHR